MNEDSTIQINIGKKGITSEVCDEIAKMLKKRKHVNVKLLRSAIDGKDREDIAGMLEMIRQIASEKLEKSVSMSKPKGFSAEYSIS